MATRKRFTKALLLRLLAVGLFICLGTFAVLHSIHNQKKKQADAGDPSAEVDGEPQVEVQVTDESEGLVQKVSGIDELNKPVVKAANDTGNAAKSLLPKFSGGSSTKSSTPPQFRGGGSSLSPGFPARQTNSTADTSKPPTRSLVPPLGSRPSGTPAMQASSTTKPPGSLPSRPGSSLPGLGSKPSTTAPKVGSASDFAQRSSRATTPSGLPPLNPKSTTPSPSTSTPDRLNSSAAGLLGRKPAAAPDGNSFRPGASSTLPNRNSNNTSSGMLSDRTRTSPGPPSQPSSRSSAFPTLPGSSNSDSNSTQASSRLPSLRTNPNAQPRVNPTLNSTPIVPKNPSRSLIPDSSLPGRSVASNDSPTRSIQGTAARSPGLRPSNMSSGTLRSNPPSTPASNIRNVSAQQEFQNGQRPRTTLASAPIGSNASSAVAQPTPGAREFQGVQLPALAVQKLMPREIQVNREATFELIVKNTGKATADGVQVHDFVPEGTRFVQATPPASPTADGRIRWDLGSMQPGQQTSIKMKVLPLRPGNVGSVAHVTFGAQATAQTVCTKPELTIRAEAPETVLIGQDVIMNIAVENKGNGAAENVVIQEDVPDGLIFNGGQRELEYEVGTLRPGQTRNVKLRLRAAKVGQVRNILAAHGAGDLMASDSVDVQIVSPKLTVQGSGPSRKFLNRNATHTFNIANRGTAPATNMQLVAQLPRGLRFVSAPNGQYDARNHAVVWRMARLDQQKSQDVQIVTTPVAEGEHQINFTAAADLNLREQAQQTLSVRQLSELFFDIDDTADAIEVGTGTTFRVKVVNQGQIPAKNVQVRVEFAPAMQPRSVEGGVGNQIQGQTVVLDTIPSMQPNQQISFVISANALQAGEHRTVVSVKSDDREIAVSKEESTHVYSDR